MIDVTPSEATRALSDAVSEMPLSSALDFVIGLARDPNPIVRLAGWTVALKLAEQLKRERLHASIFELWVAYRCWGRARKAYNEAIAAHPDWADPVRLAVESVRSRLPAKQQLCWEIWLSPIPAPA